VQAFVQQTSQWGLFNKAFCCNTEICCHYENINIFVPIEKLLCHKNIFFLGLMNEPHLELPKMRPAIFIPFKKIESFFIWLHLIILIIVDGHNKTMKDILG
jgi:hypothetical protein